MEWIEGRTVRAALDEWVRATAHGLPRDEAVELMRKIGQEVGRLHAAGMSHGDLTTSNLMLRPVNGETQRSTLEGDVVLIDFGLASQTFQEEDRAVDLYVLERAFGSTHPTVEDLFHEVLVAYGKSFSGAKVVLKKLEDVRMRGRKRSMVG